MKSKLNLAIIAIILRFVLEYSLSNILYYNNEYNEIVFWIQNILTIVYTLSPLGVLPFLIALYNSNVFSKLMKEKPSINDQLWVSHFFKRLISISVVNALPFTILLSGEKGMGAGLAIAYGLILTFSATFLFLLVEAVILYRKKIWYKLYWNIMLIIAMLMMLMFVSQMN